MPLGAHFGPFLEPPGLSFGRSWATLGRLLGALGSLLGSLGVLLGPSYALLGALGAVFGASFGSRALLGRSGDTR